MVVEGVDVVVKGLVGNAVVDAGGSDVVDVDSKPAVVGVVVVAAAFAVTCCESPQAPSMARSVTVAAALTNPGLVQRKRGNSRDEGGVVALPCRCTA